MALTAEQYQDLIVGELGDDAALAARIATLWELADQGDSDLAGQYLRCKLRAVDLLLGRAAGKVNFQALDGASVDLSDWFDHLTQLRATLAEEVAAIAGVAGGYGVGQITQQAPVMEPEPLDPNDRGLRGDPLRPGRGGFRP